VGEERVAWVTGGASGIGAAVVEGLVATGSVVAVLDRRAPREDVDWEQVDLGDAPAVGVAVDALALRTGWPDQLVLCAGIAGASAPVGELGLGEWDRVLAVNVTGGFLVLSRVLPHMRARGHGRVVTVSSGTAVRPGPGVAAYAASKAAVIALTKVVALEGAPDGVTANCVAPGVTLTPLMTDALGSEEAVRALATDSPLANPQGEVLLPEEVAEAVVWLCGEAAARLNGQVLHVNGGSLMPG
jgi:NAD(P)-dependent dehydrogenase (short-subunit alcohol dehydrogenase family)